MRISLSILFEIAAVQKKSKFTKTGNMHWRRAVHPKISFCIEKKVRHRFAIEFQKFILVCKTRTVILELIFKEIVPNIREFVLLEIVCKVISGNFVCVPRRRVRPRRDILDSCSQQADHCEYVKPCGNSTAKTRPLQGVSHPKRTFYDRPMH